MEILISNLIKGKYTYPSWSTQSIYEINTKEKDDLILVYYKTKTNKKISKYFPKSISLTPQLIYALGLIKGEGANALGKSNYRRFTFTNTDYKVINFVLNQLEKSKLFNRKDFIDKAIHIFHYKNSEKEVIKYWSKKLNISKNKFQCFDKTKKTSNYGVCHIYISDVLLRRIVDLLQEYLEG